MSWSLRRRAPLPALAVRIERLTGWRRYLLAAGLGAVATLALPPVGAIPLLWLAFPGLVWLLDGARGGRGAFAAGWWFGFGHFATGFYWVGISMLVDPVHFAWMIPFAVGGLGAGIAIFPALSSLAAWRLAPSGPARVLMLAGAWGVGEWLRGWVLTGFPWNLIATVWLPVLSVAQLASLVGAYGLGIVTVLVAAMPAVLVEPGRRGLAPVGAALALLVLVAGWGAWRMPAEAWPDQPKIRLRLIQPAVPESLKWQPDLVARQFEDNLALTRSPGIASITDVIWPETAVPFALDQVSNAAVRIGAAAPPGGLVITGAIRAAPPGPNPDRFWNSIDVVDDRGAVIDHYDKAHLVPFGEYVPLRSVLPIAKLTPGGTDFSAGPGPLTLGLPGLPPVGMLICYEVIFPGQVVDPAHRPGWLLNVTNDGWFGDSAGPYQHFAAARLRAIEEGLPLVRDANTGISAVVDPFGRVTAELGLERVGVLDAGLPEPLAPTPFSRLGNAVALVLAGLAAIGSLLLTRVARDHARR